MTILHWIIYLFSGAAAGTINAVAGGGSLIIYPILLSLGSTADNRQYHYELTYPARNYQFRIWLPQTLIKTGGTLFLAVNTLFYRRPVWGQFCWLIPQTLSSNILFLIF
jgi:hypothetical protein